MKSRQEYRYVARRALESDKKFLARNYGDKVKYVISFSEKKGHLTSRQYIWVEDFSEPGETLVVLESFYNGRSFHNPPSPVFKACKKAIDRLVAEENEENQDPSATI